MAPATSPPIVMELAPFLVLDARTATSLELTLEGATGVEIAVEPVPTGVDRAMLVGLEVAPGPAARTDPAFELHDEVPLVPGAHGFCLAIPLSPDACCLRLVARIDGEPDAARPARALVRARWVIAGNREVEARASVRVHGWTVPMGPWPRVEPGPPPAPEHALVFGGALGAALHRVRTGR